MAKIKKLTSALYRVSALLPDSEPLKWLLRTKAIGVYENTTLVALPDSGAKTGKDILLEKIFSDLPQLIDALELCSSGTLVSSLNYEVLKREYVNIKKFIEGRKTELAPEQKLISCITDITEPTIHSIEQPKAINETNKTNMSNKTNVSNMSNKTNMSNYFNPGQRKERIIDFLKGKEAKTISEIRTIFNGIGKKSVQRDLFDLVKLGQLKMEGDRRWRKYALFQT